MQLAIPKAFERGPVTPPEIFEKLKPPLKTPWIF
jgi:hypothetical protein